MYYTQNGPSSYTDYFRKSPSKHLQTGFLSTKDDLARTKFSDTSMLVLDTSELSIKPAFSKPEQPVVVNNYVGTPYVPEKDKNSILSVMMRKGIKPQVVIKPDTFIPKEDKKAGPAQAKLKAMLGKPLQKASKIQPTSDRTTSKRQQLKKSEPSDIGEEINEEFDEYANESFDKLSGAYESIRESIIGESIIRQSMAGESNNVIKESIRQSIRESFASSSSRIKQSIREDIRESLQDSNRSFKEEIIEEISGSNRKSKESIEEVYQENFEEESLSNSVSKSHSKFKKSQKLDESLSQSASKSFRMKTNIAKSLKYAEELSKKEKERLGGGDDKKITESLDKQKQNIKRIQENIAKLLTKKPTIFAPDKNKDLYYNFKIEINKLLMGDQFQSRLKKLVSFLNVGDDILPNKQYINDLEDNILKNVLGEIRNIKVGQSQLDEVERLKKEYEAKLTDQLRMQEVNLRAQMNQKLSEKDMQLKKMIAELQSRMMARTFQPGNYYRQDHGQSRTQYEVESDYSIDSENISWKADLWQLLPEYEKKKLYEKQTAEVTKFLADVMINEIKEEALERSLDISFEFPEEYNISLPEQPPRQEKSQSKMPERSFTKKESEAKHERSSDFLSDLPKISAKKATPNEDKSFTSSKDDYETKFQPVRKDQKIKTDVIKILSQYKTIYLKKKLEVIKNLLKVLTSKDAKTQNYLYSSIQQLTILTQRQFKKEHQLFVRAYEEELIISLVNIYTRSLDRKQTMAESQMKNMYDRLVVVCQVATADKCTQRVSLDAEKDAVFNVEALTKEALIKMEASPCPIEIIASENYMELKTKKEEKQVKNELVEHIVNILSAEFAKEFPKKKK